MLKAVGATTMSYTYHPTHKHALERISLNGVEYLYTYDANGNMAASPDFSDPGAVGWRAITYNVNNMPEQIEYTKGGGTVRTDFVYDGESVRAKKVVQGGFTTYYIGDHFEITDGIETTKYIFAGDIRIAKITSVFQGSAQALPNENSVTSGAASGGCYITEAGVTETVSDSETLTYYHKDHLGSSTALTDANGVKVETTEYMPFGHQRDHTGTVVSNYRYTDQELDPETGLYNYGARLYDPVIGRFISPDSLVPDPYDPQSLNRYSYCRNSPMSYTDPSGYFYDPNHPAGSNISVITRGEGYNRSGPRHVPDLELPGTTIHEESWGPKDPKRFYQGAVRTSVTWIGIIYMGAVAAQKTPHIFAKIGGTAVLIGIGIFAPHEMGYGISDMYSGWTGEEMIGRHIGDSVIDTMGDELAPETKAKAKAWSDLGHTGAGIVFGPPLPGSLKTISDINNVNNLVADIGKITRAYRDDDRKSHYGYRGIRK